MLSAGGAESCRAGARAASFGFGSGAAGAAGVGFFRGATVLSAGAACRRDEDLASARVLVSLVRAGRSAGDVSCGLTTALGAVVSGALPPALPPM